jgi:hypothetical protein
LFSRARLVERDDGDAQIVDVVHAVDVDQDRVLPRRASARKAEEQSDEKEKDAGRSHRAQDTRGRGRMAAARMRATFPGVGGGSIGLVMVFIACGFFAALITACLVVLYVWARIRRGHEPRVRVVSMDRNEDES